MRDRVPPMRQPTDFRHPGISFEIYLATLEFVDSLWRARFRSPRPRIGRYESGFAQRMRYTFIARLTPIRVDHARRMRGIIIVALYLLNH